MITRRQFLLNTSATLALLASPLARSRTVKSAERRLGFYNLHTGEQLSATYWANGSYINDELAAISQVLRDHRTNTVASIDVQLIDQLFALQQYIGHTSHFHIFSGYRSQESNTKLRQVDTRGVAKRSLHMQGRAIDLRLPGVELKTLHKAAIKMRAGGVGYYPASNFIHLDTGRFRTWGS